jgi:glycosyltransferase involved in cell wall biosynthesis
MKILFLAPQPFFQERGTTIAIDLMLQALSGRGDEVDLLTLPVGEDRVYPGMKLIRVSPPFPPAEIKPGLSVAKVYCDLFLLRDAFRMLRATRYDLIYAVEEASFIAMVLARMFRVPYVFDMDSSMSTQILDSFTWIRPLGRLLMWIETLPLRQAAAVVPMCEDLAVYARRYCRGFVHVLKDVSLIDSSAAASTEDLRLSLGVDGPLLLYVGNLERYQGIDLLLESMAALGATHPTAELVIIGGRPPKIAQYRKRARGLGIEARVHLIGPRPVDQLGSYLRQADLLISPRIRGTNTPMKVYSYLDSGVPVVATALPTHSQLMTENEGALVPPEPLAMAAALGALIDDPEKRRRLASNARALIRSEHSMASFRRNVDVVFNELESRLALGR